MSKVNSETAEPNKTTPEAIGIPIESRAPLSAYREPLFRRLIGKSFSPTIWQALLVLLDQGFQSATNFALGVFLARSLTKTDYGIFVVLMSVILTAQGGFHSLISQPSTVYAPKMQLRRRAIYLGSTVTHQVIMMVAITLVFALTASVMLLFRVKTLSVYLIWLLCSVTGLVVLRPFVRFLLLSTFRHELAFLMGTVINVVQCSLIVFFYIRGSLTVLFALIIIAASNSIVALAMLVFAAFRGILVINRHYALRDFKRNWRFGKWNLGRLVTSVCTSRIYPIALAALITPAEAAVYGVCMGLAGLTHPIIMGLGVFLGPHMAKQARSVNYAKLVNHTRAAFFLVGAFSIVYLLVIGVGGERLLVFLYGGKYGGNLGVLLIIALAVAVEGLGCPAVATLSALEQPAVLFTSRLLAAIFTLTVGMLCLWVWGLLGAALALLTGSVITTGIRCVRLWNSFDSRDFFKRK